MIIFLFEFYFSNFFLFYKTLIVIEFKEVFMNIAQKMNVFDYINKEKPEFLTIFSLGLQKMTV